ncbi:MAG: hypothetical protein ACLQU4_06995 [Limisphaerales bacterium]
MNGRFVPGAVVAVVTMAVYWVFHRWYMRVGRRCRKCGRLKMRRTYKILRLQGEEISWRGREGKLRWWIRDVIKLTFIACEDCGIELEKIDRSAISVWHAQKVSLFQPEQYRIEEQTLFGLERSMPKFLGREWKPPGLAPQPSDAPPLSLIALFQDLFESLSGLLARIIKSTVDRV